MSAEDLLSRRARLGESAPAPIASEAERRGAQPTVGEHTKVVLPPSDVDVFAVWESRLVGMRDFYETPSAEMALPGFTTVGFNVPGGRAAVLKFFRYDLDPVPAIGGASNYLITLMRNGAVLPGYENLPLGQNLVDAIPCFLLADEGDTIALRIQVTGVVPGGPITFTPHFWGQLPLRGQKALGLEVGTPRRGSAAP